MSEWKEEEESTEEESKSITFYLQDWSGLWRYINSFKVPMKLIIEYRVISKF